MNECVFCKIVGGKIFSHKIWEDKEFFAFLDINPVSTGHTILIPKKHINYVFDLPDGEYKKIFETAKLLEPAIRKATKAKKIGIAIEGISVSHAHLHLIPVNNGNDLDPCKARKAANHELLEISEKIIKELGESK